MAESFKQIKNRIRSIQNTEKVTNALEMISVTKLNRMDNILYATRPYLQKLEAFLGALLKELPEVTNPFLDKNNHSGSSLLVVITSDSGLCGLYNYNVLKAADEFIRQKGENNLKLAVIGKKGLTYFKNRKIELAQSFIGLNGRYTDKSCEEIEKYLTASFLSDEVEGVYFAYTHFLSPISVKPRIEKFLGIETREGQGIGYLVEPDLNSIVEAAVLRYISTKLRLLLLEAFTSEHAARTIAMKTATENANDLLHKLILLRNKVRQANITRDILEIISSAEALRG